MIVGSLLLARPIVRGGKRGRSSVGRQGLTELFFETE